MVETIKCDLCGVETRYYVTKEIGGKELNFCCRGCLQVFEMSREEIQQRSESKGGEQKSNVGWTVEKNS
jgi:ribosome-binding protein aMBF1 (putative translation factor)